MIPRHPNLSFVLCVAFGLLFAVDCVIADQPHMSAAIELLQAAKKSDKPLPMLNAAKKHLEDASHNKGGARKEALAAINDAIAQLRVGDKKKMAQKIDNAIANVHQGKDNGS